MTIRTETSDEFPQICELIRVAFETAKVSAGTEQDYVDCLRNSGGYIPELALVAEEAGQLIGYIMLTRIAVVNVTDKFESLLLAPVCVALEHREK